MKCCIGKDFDPIDCKVTENLGFQGGYYAKFVEYDGEEFVVIKKDGKWVRAIAFILPRIPIVGQNTDEPPEGEE